MPLSTQQHLGNYHQSVPALSGDALFCATFPTVRKDFTQSETLEYTVDFIHINILHFFPHISPPSHFFLLTGLLHASAFYLLTFSGNELLSTVTGLRPRIHF